MQRSQPAEIWEIINCREMDSGRKIVDSQRFFVDRFINISTALSTIGSGKPKACNNSYTVQWTKVQKVIKNEIKVSTGYKTSIQTRSRKIIEMIVRLQKNDKKRQGEEYKELWMRCKINGKTCFIYIKEQDMAQEVEWEIEGLIYCWKGWQFKKNKIISYYYVHKMWWRNNQMFIFHEKKIYHNKSRLHTRWSQRKKDIRRLKLIVSIKDPCPTQKKKKWER